MHFLPKVLFVCTYRGGRSQVADVFAKRYAADVFESDCACFDPGKIGQGFVDLLDSFDIEISSDSPKSVFALAKQGDSYEYVVCLCYGVGTEMCSLFRTNIDRIFPDCIERIHWDVSDFGECQDAEEGFGPCVEKVCRGIERDVIALAEHVRKSMNA